MSRKAFVTPKKVLMVLGLGMLLVGVLVLTSKNEELLAGLDGGKSFPLSIFRHYVVSVTKKFNTNALEITDKT